MESMAARGPEGLARLLVALGRTPRLIRDSIDQGFHLQEQLPSKRDSRCLRHIEDESDGRRAGSIQPPSVSE